MSRRCSPARRSAPCAAGDGAFPRSRRPISGRGGSSDPEPQHAPVPMSGSFGEPLEDHFTKAHPRGRLLHIQEETMGHEMTSSDQMYSVREAPWHLGSGTNVLMLDAAPETRMVRIEVAGHAFTVEENDVYLRKEDPAGEPGHVDATFPKVDGWKALTRSDTADVLNVARGSYEVVQNIVGHELFETLSKGTKLDDGTGGTVKGGAVCYLSPGWTSRS